MEKLNEINSKSILTPSNLPTDDYVVNPYSGCSFGCVYCYADFMRRFTGHVDEKWGEYVDVKINTVEIFEKEILNLVKSIKAGRRDLTKYKNGIRPCIMFSSVTDPYQGIESKYKLTRSCLEIILNSGLDCDVSI